MYLQRLHNIYHVFTIILIVGSKKGKRSGESKQVQDWKFDTMWRRKDERPLPCPDLPEQNSDSPE